MFKFIVPAGALTYLALLAATDVIGGSIGVSVIAVLSVTAAIAIGAGAGFSAHKALALRSD